jgi:hypothetical protein
MGGTAAGQDRLSAAVIIIIIRLGRAGGVRVRAKVIRGDADYKKKPF